jgi:hypothetical protein
MRRLHLLLGCALPVHSACAAAVPPAWDFPGASLLVGAASVVALVLLGRAIAAPARRHRAGADRRESGDAR